MVHHNHHCILFTLVAVSLFFAPKTRTINASVISPVSPGRGENDAEGKNLAEYVASRKARIHHESSTLMTQMVEPDVKEEEVKYTRLGKGLVLRNSKQGSHENKSRTVDTPHRSQVSTVRANTAKRTMETKRNVVDEASRDDREIHPRIELATDSVDSIGSVAKRMLGKSRKRYRSRKKSKSKKSKKSSSKNKSNSSKKKKKKKKRKRKRKRRKKRKKDKKSKKSMKEEEESSDELPTIAQIASATEELSTLVVALKAAGLYDDLNTDGSAGMVTVFAPTNEAFDKLPPGTLDSLLADPEALQKVLLYHVVPEVIYSYDMRQGQQLLTLHGGSITVTNTNPVTLNNNARVVLADAQAKIGVVHVINEVLLPPVANA